MATEKGEAATHGKAIKSASGMQECATLVMSGNTSVESRKSPRCLKGER